MIRRKRPNTLILSPLCVACLLSLGACGGGEAPEAGSASDPASADAAADGRRQILASSGRNADTTVPLISIASQGAVTDAGTVSVSGSASDNRSVKTVYWANDRGGNGITSLSGSGSPVSWNIAALPLQTGDNVLTFTAEDGSGNRGSARLTVTRPTTATSTTTTTSATGSGSTSTSTSTSSGTTGSGTGTTGTSGSTTASTADTLAATLVMDPSRLPREDWTLATSRYQTVPAWTSWVQGRAGMVDAWNSKVRERADLVGGYMHDYIDPVTGLPLTWTPDSPEPPDGTTDREIRFKRAWVFHLRDYNIRRLIDAARVWKTTGNTRYADWAAAQLDFYAANYALWPLRTVNGRGRMYQNGLDEATSSFTLLEAARLLTPYAGSTRAQAWRTGLFAPMAENLKTISSPLTNIGLWHGAAVTSIGLRLGDGALVDWGLNSTQGLRATLAACISADYLWNEGSFSYNAWVISALNLLFTRAALEGQAALVPDVRQAMTRLLFAPLDYRFDDGMLPTPSDASPQKAIDPNQHLELYRSVPTYWGVLKASTYQSWDTLVDPPPAVPVAPVLAATVTANFPANRMAVLRTGAWNAFVHYGQAAPNHAQQEALSYELYAGTTRISSDPGNVSYGSPYASGYFSKAPANNMPLVEGLGQASWAPGTVDAFDAVSARLAATQPAFLPYARASRSFAMTGTGLSESTQLSVSDGVARRLGVVFHTPCTLSPLSGLTLADASTVKPPATSATAYWSGMQPYRAGTSWSVRLSCGGLSFSYTVNGPSTQTVFIGSGPTTPLPATRPVLYYETRGTQVRFDAVISAM